MKVHPFKKISDVLFLNKFKDKLFRADEKGLTEDEIKSLNRFKPQNPFGIVTLIAGGACLAFGSMYLLIPILTLVFCILTYGTFDAEKEDNPWPFYVGFFLTLIGLYMNLLGIQLQIVF